MTQFETIRSAGVGARAAIDEGLRAHMNKVYGLMSVAMLVTAGVAWSVGTSDALMSIFRNPATGAMTILGWVAMFAPLAMVFAFGALVNRMSAAAAQLFFYCFAAAMGLSIAWIFMAFTGISIAQTFVVASIAFASLSLYGYVTKRDLSGMGAFLMMGLVGLIVAMVINLFLQSGMLGFAISVIGLLIFAGLTAFDTQRIKTEYIMHAQAMDQEWLGKAAIMGALSLYLNFINIFMFLLQFMGNRE